MCCAVPCVKLCWDVGSGQHWAVLSTYHHLGLFGPHVQQQVLEIGFQLLVGLLFGLGGLTPV